MTLGIPDAAGIEPKYSTASTQWVIGALKPCNLLLLSRKFEKLAIGVQPTLGLALYLPAWMQLANRLT